MQANSMANRPAILNSKEEIGWKLQQQCRNVQQEAPWPPQSKLIFVPN
jgi:hypothetical protein